MRSRFVLIGYTEIQHAFVSYRQNSATESWKDAVGITRAFVVLSATWMLSVRDHFPKNTTFGLHEFDACDDMAPLSTRPIHNMLDLERKKHLRNEAFGL